MFNVYLNNETQAVARGGRFDGMVIGQPVAATVNYSDSAHVKRPATGFSLDLTRLQSHIDLPAQSLVVVDYDSCQHLDTEAEQRLLDKINELRGPSHKLRVIKPLSAQDSQNVMTHRLILKDGDWQLKAK